jgi:hypothetical protein
MIQILDRRLLFEARIRQVPNITSQLVLRQSDWNLLLDRSTSVNVAATSTVSGQNRYVRRGAQHRQVSLFKFKKSKTAHIIMH